MFLEIAIDAPLRRTFDYRSPADAPRELRPGVRVRVPFGRRRVIGVLLRVKPTTDIPAGKLKIALEVLDKEPVIDSGLLGLLTWSAGYYHHPIGEVIAAALPTAIRIGAPAAAGIETWNLTQLGELEWPNLPKRSTRLRAVAAALARGAERADLEEIPAWRSSLRQLQDRGWALSKIIANHSPCDSAIWATPSKHELSLKQEEARNAILAAKSEFRTWLLHGVTGSGKTEVYLQVIENLVASGKQALVLVPEISLTPQLVARFQERFSAPLAVLHSSIGDHERLLAWRGAGTGAAPIVIGTRSAIFAPLRSPGIIIVDEEHDSSYKQQEGFRYSARDLAIARAQRLGIPVVLGSATPSLESLARTKKRSSDLLTLPTRAGNAQPPKMRLIDLRNHPQTNGVATPTLQNIQRHLESDGQVLLYLNRRGYAPALFCPTCGWCAVCSRCDARLTVHRRANKLICHHCGTESVIHTQCGNCRAPVKPVGEGTERIETAIANLFPLFPAARIDRDNIRRKGELEAILRRVQSGEVRLVIGTQMLAKGHHFPNVTLVVVLNADQGLFGIDFRAAERLAQSIVQVAGRAGRAERSGEVLIQTEYPEHPLITNLLKGGYTAFAESALSEREHAHWPPFTRLALLRAEATDMQHALHFLSVVRERAVGPDTQSVNILGPVPAPMSRRAGHFRAQLLFKSPSHAPLQTLLSRLIPALETLPQAKKTRWSIDVDPVELF